MVLVKGYCFAVLIEQEECVQIAYILLSLQNMYFASWNTLLYIISFSIHSNLLQ